ncbi:MAG: hypothetical protein ACP5II_06895 [Infirmifilum sp.]|uniref:hypothetical protein n=1 Tax=Infirmifilum sp. TaxID=2856575 RepID=UPI003D0CEE8F
MARSWRFYSREELAGALVYDSEGLLCGEVADLTLTEEQAFLDVQIRKCVGEVSVNTERLSRELQSRGLQVDGLTLAELVSLARGLGLDVPQLRVERDLTLLKMRIPVEDIQWIDHKTLQPRGEIKVILLKTPREAEFRGWKPGQFPKVPRRDEVKGKLVLSLSSGIVGLVEDVVVGAGELGLRVYRASGARELRWLAFINALKKANRWEIADALSREIDPYSSPRLTGEDVERALELARSIGGGDVEELASRYITESRDVLDIAWRTVRRLGDAVITE